MQTYKEIFQGKPTCLDKVDNSHVALLPAWKLQHINVTHTKGGGGELMLLAWLTNWLSGKLAIWLATKWSSNHRWMVLAAGEYLKVAGCKENQVSGQAVINYDALACKSFPRY